MPWEHSCKDVCGPTSIPAAAAMLLPAYREEFQIVPHVETWVVIDFPQFNLRFPDYEISTFGRYRNRWTKKILTPDINKGYRRAQMYTDVIEDAFDSNDDDDSGDDDGDESDEDIEGAETEPGKPLRIRRRRQVSIARLVLFAFVGPNKEGETADHIVSANKLDDSIENLRWATLSQQNKNQQKSVCDRREIPIIGTRIKDGFWKLFRGAHHAERLLCSEYGVPTADNSAITKCAKGKRKKHHKWRFVYAPIREDAPSDDPGWFQITHRDLLVCFAQGQALKENKAFDISSLDIVDGDRGTKKWLHIAGWFKDDSNDQGDRCVWRISELLTERATDDEYARVKIYGKSYQVHRLMIVHFSLPPTDAPYVVDHINNNNRDARLCNLQWLTKKENSKKDCGGKPCVIDGVEYVSQKRAADELGVDPSTISRQLKRTRK